MGTAAHAAPLRRHRGGGRGIARGRRRLRRARPRRRGRSGRASEPGAVRDRPRRRRDDGEPLVRPSPRLAARRRRKAGRPDATSTLEGAPHQTFPLAPDFQGCAHLDPDHSYDGARVEWNNGACDGWLLPTGGDLFPIGYYRQTDLPFLGAAAPAWTVCDRYFAAILGPTFPNRLYLHSGVTDRIENSFTRVDLPTIWDRLAAKGLSGRYYCGNVSFLLLWNQKYNSITRTTSQFFKDCKTGKLPTCRTSTRT